MDGVATMRIKNIVKVLAWLTLTFGLTLIAPTRVLAHCDSPTTFRSVVLPLPEGPTSAMNSPVRTSRSTPRKARTSCRPV